VPSSPFFAPSTPSVVVVQQTPGGTRRPVRQKEKVVEHKSGLLGCTSNLINAIVGSGIVGIPFAIKEAGFVAGVLLIILCAVLTEKSLRLLIATAKQ
jgi:sodium-coupled neutral amino acid transporter 11